MSTNRIHLDFITPKVLSTMSDNQLLELNEELHEIYGLKGFNKESILNAYIFLKNECEKRSLEIPKFNDELEADARMLGESQIIEMAVIGKLVPLIVTHQALSLTGSVVYGLTEPKDYDWVIRHPERLPELEQALVDFVSARRHHFIYELKGPSWKHIPIGDFILVPSLDGDTTQKERTVFDTLENFPKRIFIKDYLFSKRKDGNFSFRVNSDLPDNGLRLKLERIFQDSHLEVMFSTKGRVGETCLGQLWLRRYDKLIVVDVDEPEFEDFYPLKPISEVEAPKITAKTSKVEFGKWFPPIKVGAFGYAEKEVFDINDSWRYWGQPMLDQHKLLIAQQKFDGIRMQFHVDKKESNVLIFTEGSLERDRQGIERSKYLPDLVRDCLRVCQCHDCILDTEVVWWKEGKPLPRHQMVAISGGKEVIEGEDIRVNVFDIIWLNGKYLSNVPYDDRLKMLDEVIPKEGKHIKKVDSIIINNEKEYFEAFQKLSSIEGSEGMMVKTPALPPFSPTGRTSQMTKIKKLFELDVVIIGRRKVPMAKPTGKKMTAEQMEKELPELIKKSNTWTFRCAFLGKGNKLIPLEAEKKYTPGDLELKWDEERQKWVGTEDPKYWEMGLGFKNRMRGELCYGNTYNFKAPEGVEPKIGDIITVAPVLLRVWKDAGEYHVSWTFPRVRNMKPERNKPDDWKVVNEIIKAVSRRHGLESEEILLYEAEDLTVLTEVKSAFPMLGGKSFLAKRLASLIPPHKRYVEPFIGGGSVLLAKEKSEEEVIGDIDPDLIATWRFIKYFDDKDIEEFKSYVWKPSKERWDFLRKWNPTKRLDKVYKFLYLKYHSWARDPAISYSPNESLTPENIIKRLSTVKERVKDVKIIRQDAIETIKQFDSPDTFFFLDPPFVTGHFSKRVDLRRWVFPPERLLGVLKNLQGKFLLILNDSQENRKLFTGFEQAMVMTPFPTSRGKGHTYEGPTESRALLLVANYPIHLFDSLSEAGMTHEQTREFTERIFGDPYMIVQPPDKKTKFVIQHHVRGIWTDDEREELLGKLRDVKNQDDLNKLWSESDCEYLLAPLSSWQDELQNADDERKDITQIMNKHLSKEPPKLSELDLSRVVNRGNAHTDFRIRHPEEDHLIGWTLTTPRVVLQYLETGKLEFPLRDRFLQNQPDDKFPVARKAVQPEEWFSLVTPKRPTFEAPAGEVGATAETGGRLIFKTQGELAFGVSKDDYHEYYLWFEKPYEHLSGRWGCQKLEGRSEYLKIPAEKGKPPPEWWMMNKPHKTQAPYILTHNRKEEEAKAKKEGIKRIIWNPEIIDILSKDKLGRQWLVQGLTDSSQEFIMSKKREFSKGNTEWRKSE